MKCVLRANWLKRVCVPAIAVIGVLLTAGCERYKKFDGKFELNISRSMTFTNGKQSTEYTVDGITINGVDIQLASKVTSKKDTFMVPTVKYGDFKIMLTENETGIYMSDKQQKMLDSDKVRTPDKVKGMLMNYDTKKPIPGYKVCLFKVTGAADADGWANGEMGAEVKVSDDGIFAFESIASTGAYMFMVKYENIDGERYSSVKHIDGKNVEVNLNGGADIDLGKVWAQLR